MKIILTCCMGMSTSILAELMNEEAKSQGFNDKVECIDNEKIVNMNIDSDVLLLGPQIKHAYRRLYRKFGDRMAVAMIDLQDYGCMNAKNVLDFAHKIYDEFCANGEYLENIEE